jgi:hypothetical protein
MINQPHDLSSRRSKNLSQFIRGIEQGILNEEYSFDDIFNSVEKPDDYELNPDAKRRYEQMDNEMAKLCIKAEAQWPSVASRLYRHISQSELDKLQQCGGFTTPSGLEVPSWNRITENSWNV